MIRYRLVQVRQNLTKPFTTSIDLKLMGIMPILAKKKTVFPSSRAECVFEMSRLVRNKEGVKPSDLIFVQDKICLGSKSRGLHFLVCLSRSQI